MLLFTCNSKEVNKILFTLKYFKYFILILIQFALGNTVNVAFSWYLKHGGAGVLLFILQAVSIGMYDCFSNSVDLYLYSIICK